MTGECRGAAPAGGAAIHTEFPEPTELSRVPGRIKSEETKRESRVIFAAVVEQMRQKPEPPSRPVGDLQAPQLVELAA